MEGVQRAAWSTRATVWTIVVLTIGFVVFAVLTFTTRNSGISASADATSVGLDGQAESMMSVLGSLAVLAISALTGALAIGIARRREGARHAAFMTFGVLGFVSLAASLPGMLADPPASGAPFGLAVGLANVAIVVLLLHPATADDFDLAQRQRDRLEGHRPSRVR